MREDTFFFCFLYLDFLTFCYYYVTCYVTVTVIQQLLFLGLVIARYDFWDRYIDVFVLWQPRKATSIKYTLRCSAIDLQSVCGDVGCPCHICRGTLGFLHRDLSNLRQFTSIGRGIKYEEYILCRKDLLNKKDCRYLGGGETERDRIKLN